MGFPRGSPRHRADVSRHRADDRARFAGILVGIASAAFIGMVSVGPHPSATPRACNPRPMSVSSELKAFNRALAATRRLGERGFAALKNCTSSTATVAAHAGSARSPRPSSSLNRRGCKKTNFEKAHWVENIVPGTVADNTLSGYRVAVRVHLVPGVGAHRIDRLEPEHLERLYRKMMRNGSRAATAHQAHRTVRTALNEAVRRGYIARNPATLAKPPRLTEEDIEPYDVGEVKRILEAAATRRNSTRWPSCWPSACGRGRLSDCSGPMSTSTKGRFASDAPGYAPSGRTAATGHPVGISTVAIARNGARPGPTRPTRSRRLGSGGSVFRTSV